MHFVLNVLVSLAACIFSLANSLLQEFEFDWVGLVCQLLRNLGLMTNCLDWQSTGCCKFCFCFARFV